MAWDEALFGWLSRQIQQWRNQVDPERLARTALAEPIQRRLAILASAAAQPSDNAPGAEFEFLLVDGPGGVGATQLQIPKQVNVFPTLELNAQLLVVRALLGGLAIRRRIAVDEIHQSDHNHSSKGSTAHVSLLADLQRDWPGAWPLWLALDQAATHLPEAEVVPWLTGQQLANSDTLALVSAAGQGDGPGRRVSSEVRSRPRPPPKRRRVLQQHDAAENPVTHSFEKVHTAEDYQGGQKRADGADEVRDHAAALDELELDQIVVSATPTAAVYQADLGWRNGGIQPGEIASPRQLSYDEWDAGKQRYLSSWCSLSETRPEPDWAGGAALLARVRRQYRKAIAQVRSELAKQEQALSWHDRQMDGPEIDMDALVDREAALISGHDGDERLYRARRRKGHDVEVMLLLDASMSTDSWVANRRVIDVERDAAVVLAQALDEQQVAITVGAFHSYSRSDCRFELCKRREEPWSDGLARLAALQPAGYTRVGPALRHGATLLQSSKAQRKLLILLTDGKPSDTDRYEGRWGQADVRQAIREARQRGMKVFALSVDPRARAHLPGMFGGQGFAGLQDPGELGRAVARIFERAR